MFPAVRPLVLLQCFVIRVGFVFIRRRVDALRRMSGANPQPIEMDFSGWPLVQMVFLALNGGLGRRPLAQMEFLALNGGLGRPVHERQPVWDSHP